MNTKTQKDVFFDEATIMFSDEVSVIKEIGWPRYINTFVYNAQVKIRTLENKGATLAEMFITLPITACYCYRLCETEVQLPAMSDSLIEDYKTFLLATENDPVATAVYNILSSSSRINSTSLMEVQEAAKGTDDFQNLSTIFAQLRICVVPALQELSSLQEKIQKITDLTADLVEELTAARTKQ